MRILGIDPGSVILGYGIIDDLGQEKRYVTSGCIRLGKHSWPLRLQTIFDDLSFLIDSYQPQVLSIEQVFVHKNVASALKLGQARGVAMVAAVKKGLSVSEYAARYVKKAIVGYGGADKAQVQYMIQSLLKLAGLPQVDAADALALALCHAYEQTRIRIQEKYP